MNQYAGTQQDASSGLVNNPRYQGQAGGTVPMGQDGRGPQQETRYGAVPLSTGTTGSQQQQVGMVDPKARPSQAGYGNQPAAGYGSQAPAGYGSQVNDGQGLNSGYGGNQAGNQAGYGGNQVGSQAGYGGNQAGYGENQGAGYDEPRRHAQGQDYNPNVNHPSEERWFGGGLGAQGYDQSQQLGDGYNNRMATGADAYGQPQTGGAGYDARTATGNDAYVHGNHPPGMQDRVEGVNEPSALGGENESTLERMPPAMRGEHRTEPGYDMSKGHHHLPGQGDRQQNLDGTGLGGQPDTGLDATRLDNERRGKQFEDTTGTDSYDDGTGTGTGYDGTGTGTGYDETTATGTAPPKKGLMTKIKEKLHH